jgi:NTE family protein
VGDHPRDLLSAAAQGRTSQQFQLARENITRLRTAVDIVLFEPVPYQKAAGTGFFEQFLDNAQ